MSPIVGRRSFLKGGAALGAALGLFNRPIHGLASEPHTNVLHGEQLGWRLGCCAYSFRTLTFYETIAKVASLGLKLVVGFNWQILDSQTPGAVLGETMTAAQRQEAQKRLADADVTLAACYCRALDKEETCRRVFEFAKALGIETLDGEPPLAALSRSI